MRAIVPSQFPETESLLECFRSIFDRSPDLLAMWGETGRLVYVNESFCGSTGRSEEECLSLTSAEVNPEWSDGRYASLFADVHEHGPQSFESGHLRHDGSALPVDVTVEPFIFEGRKVLLTRSRDITARKAAEQRLNFEHQVSQVAAQAGNLSQAAIDFLGPFVDVLDMDAAEFWRFESIGRGGGEEPARLIRQSLAVREGMEHREVWISASEELVVERGVGLLGRAWESGQAQWTEDLSSVHGFDRSEAAEWVEFEVGCAFPVLDGFEVVGVIAFFSRSAYADPPGLLSSLVNLGRTIGQACKRLETERTLRLRDRAVDATADGLVIADARAKGTPIVYVNSGFEALTGYSSAECLHRNCRFLQGKDTDRAAVARIKSALVQGLPIQEVILNYRKDGTPFWVELHISPVHAEDGEVTHFVAVQHDVTARIKIEGDLEAAHSAAARANEAKSTFLANMSHEIRTPMAAILGFTDALRREVQTDKGKAHLGIIKRNGAYLLRLINDILDLSKVEAGQLGIELNSTDLPALLTDVRDLMSVRAEDAGVELRFVAEGQLPASLQTDSTRLRQVLVNLISNALKFASDQPVTVTIGMTSIKGDHELRLAVADQGIGIDQEHQESVFEPFVQVHARVEAARREHGGTGLGLSITRRLVTALGGRMELESELGVGSTFTVFLPTGPLDSVPFVAFDPDHSAAPQERGQEWPDLRLNGARVLVADDRVDVGRAVAYYLEEAGAVVTHVLDGRLAVDAALEAHRSGDAFQLIFMDMQMPVLDGFGATRELRKEGYAGKIIALTAAVMANEVDRCMAAGCDGFLAKPVEEGHLLATAARLIREAP